MKNDDRLKHIQKLLDTAEGNLHSARNLLLDILGGTPQRGGVVHKELAQDLDLSSEGKIVEGIFDGEQMVSSDGKKYPVPANYASKSKLVEGDVMKLTIAEDGSLIYKQIKPAERKNLIGILAYEGGNYFVIAEGKKYKILFASVTYYKGKPGDKVSVVVPSGLDSTWAAVESVLPEHGSAEDTQQDKKQPRKFVLPEENVEILESVKEKVLAETEKQDAREEDKLSVSKDDTEDEESHVQSKEEGSKIGFHKKEESYPEVKMERPSESTDQVESIEDNSDETPLDDNHRSTSMEAENEDFVKEESDSNSLGEEVESSKDKGGVEELEI